MLTMICSAAAAQTESVLHSFLPTNGDGSSPVAGLTAGSGGVLYGTTQYGGAHASGSVFQLTPPTEASAAWTETILYSFSGAYPIAKLLVDKHGVIYGTTQHGGQQEGCGDGYFQGCGTVFRLKPPKSLGGPWIFNILYNFQGGDADGSDPEGGIVIDSEGNLYGSTYSGGSASGGIIYKLAPPTPGADIWTESILYQFQRLSDGSNPAGELTLDSAGNLYGTATYYGESNGGCYGTAFEVSPPQTPGHPWSYKVLYSFLSSPTAAYPNGDLLLGSNGALYGTSWGGGLIYQNNYCGTVFKLSPPSVSGGAWSERDLYKFQCGADGAEPLSGPTSDRSGNLYVTTTEYGYSPCMVYSCGSLVKTAPPSQPGGLWSTSILYGFTGGTDGGLAFGQPIIDSSGNVYGTTYSGGEYGDGTVFEVAP